MLLNHPLITDALQEKRESSSLNRKEFKSDVFAPCMETVAEVESSFMGAGFPVKPFLKTLSDAIKQKVEDEAERRGSCWPPILQIRQNQKRREFPETGCES